MTKYTYVVVNIGAYWTRERERGEIMHSLDG